MWCDVRCACSRVMERSRAGVVEISIWSCVRESLALGFSGRKLDIL